MWCLSQLIFWCFLFIHNGGANHIMVDGLFGNDTHSCGSSNFSPCLTIQQAVLNALDGDQIVVNGDSIYNCSTDGQGIRVLKHVEFVAVGGNVILDCRGRSRGFWF